VKGVTLRRKGANCATLVQTVKQLWNRETSETRRNCGLEFSYSFSVKSSLFPERSIL
jgi:hypothetical protein